MNLPVYQVLKCVCFHYSSWSCLAEVECLPPSDCHDELRVAWACSLDVYSAQIKTTHQLFRVRETEREA